MIVGLGLLGVVVLVVGVFGLAVREQRSYDAWRAAWDESKARAEQARHL